MPNLATPLDIPDLQATLAYPQGSIWNDVAI